MDLTAYATHSPFSDPGTHAALLAAVPPDTPSLHTAVMRTVLHYRDQTHPPTPGQLVDIDNRWIDRICDAAVDRSPGPLIQQRPATDKVGGCCRDHVLLAVAILREHGIPARSRVGFAGYLNPGFHHDHVVAERWSSAQRRWIRFDPEFAAGDLESDVHDLPDGPEAPFRTAARAWLAYRAGGTDLSDYGVAPHLPQLCGPGFVQRYLLLDLAHLMRNETLLWDAWGPGVAGPDSAPDDPAGPGPLRRTPRAERNPGTAMEGSADPAVEVNTELAAASDMLARLIVAADDGDQAAHEELITLWQEQERLRPGRSVWTLSPSGRVGRTDLLTRRTEWDAGTHRATIPLVTA